MKKMAVGILLIGAFLCSLAWADFVNVPPSEFRSWNDDADQLKMAPSGWADFCLKDTVQGAIVAPVHVPNGAIIKNIRVMYIDNDATYSIRVVLTRVNMYNGNTADIFDITSSGASVSIRTMIDSSAIPASLRLVSNAVCQYYVLAYFSDPSEQLRLYGIVVEYD
jgi:hypothetical protein